MLNLDGKPEGTEAWSELYAEHSNPQSFWAAVLRVAAETVKAESVFLYLRRDSATKRDWQRVLARPARPSHMVSPDVAEKLCAEAIESGGASGTPADFGGIGHAAVSLDVQEGEPPAVLVVVSPARSSAETASWVADLTPLRGAPRVFRTQARARRAEGDTRRIAAVLDLVILLNQETRFVAAAMRVCNELAGRHGYSRVGLGWVENEEVRLKALSHTEKFEKKMDLVRRLEGAMEECLDQDEEIVWPADEGQVTVTREHEAYATQVESQTIISAPVRLEGKAIGVLSFERGPTPPVDEDEVNQVRLYADQLGRRLDDLYREDRWWGSRAWHHLRSRAAGLLGPRHTGWKMAGFGVALLLLVLTFWHTEHRVEAAFTLRGESAVFIAAPFDGYLSELHAEIGDQVEDGTMLAAFDTRELRLQESNLRAEKVRYQREAEKARADQLFADMRINLARVQEIDAQLAIIEQRLVLAEVRSPLVGAVVEGDLRERLGSPFSKGDMLFRVAGTEDLFVEAQVDERDIDNIALGREVELAFTSRPDLTFDAVLDRIDPVAETNDQGNLFRVRCDVTEGVPEWWRPGMTGIAKIDGGRRSLLWIFTHRTIDFLRLYLWW